MRNIDVYTQKYIQDSYEDYQVRYRRKKIIEILHSGKYKHSSILEIGCGKEPLFKYLKDTDFEKYCLIEPSVCFYENAVRESGEDARIRIINGMFPQDFEPLDNEHAEKFDFIICASLLHEIEDQQFFLAALKGLCFCDTTIHINVPNAQSFHRLLAVKMGLIENEYALSERNLVYQQHNVFDLKQLTQLCADSGFCIIESGGFFIKPFTHDQMYKMLALNIIDEKVLDGLYLMDEMGEWGSEIFVNIKKVEQEKM